MNILDFEESSNVFFDYETVQKVWGKDADITVSFENYNDKKPKADEVSLRGIVRLLSDKLKFVEENRAAVEDVVAAEDIEELSESDIKSLKINWVLFIYFVDIEKCELTLYLEPQTDVLDGAEIAVVVNDDNSLTVDDIVDA